MTNEQLEWLQEAATYHLRASKEETHPVLREKHLNFYYAIWRAGQLLKKPARKPAKKANSKQLEAARKKRRARQLLKQPTK